jgi:hypothetical protein
MRCFPRCPTPSRGCLDGSTPISSSSEAQSALASSPDSLLHVCCTLRRSRVVRDSYLLVGLGITGYRRRDSNPHAFRHRNLNPACLPVPPLRLAVTSVRPWRRGTAVTNRVRRAGDVLFRSPPLTSRRTGPTHRPRVPRRAPTRVVVVLKGARDWPTATTRAVVVMGRALDLRTTRTRVLAP